MINASSLQLKTTLLHHSSTYIPAHSFNYFRKNFMFWSDTNSDRIYRAYLNGTGITTLISSGLAVTGNEASQNITTL